jgi:hypothetical protein
VPLAVSGELRWRIPPEGDPRVLRVKLAQVGLASIVCVLILLVAAPGEVLTLGLVLLLPVAFFMAFRQWRKYRESLAGPDNTWIDVEGVHWLDPAGNEQSLPRTEMIGFAIGRDDETLRPVPALTLILTGDRESQPLELHAPADEAAVRELLTGEWNLSERPASNAGEASYDVAVDVYSECHDEFQEWHFEGTIAALVELFAIVGQVGNLPLAAPGVRPSRRIVLARRREASRLAIQHDRQLRLDRDTIGGPAVLLAALSTQGASTLGSVPADTAKVDLKFDLVVSPNSKWTFHLHVRSP